ncbi:hypothetical protein [Microbacterium sp. CFBP9034]|uniref:hypothetical protein n=1 Tax=Microbacterium sp. CFBP9034 TaxID=3096540 RepID=UPI002A6A3EF0|nr:hypothetical protein [Microbacterium sp. CFBP9034]MDY0909709.1 hypothetical protein [Microbacterium sp. CFBP9034]
MTRDDDSLRAPYRAVRPVTAPTDAPWSGMLTWRPSGERCVLVDAVALGDTWIGWDADHDGHVLAALDVVRRADGHDVALPVCPERVADFLARRAAAGAPLEPGESITLGVSLLRGFGQLGGRSGATGEWWLTDAGRPVLATDASDRTAVDETASLLAALAADAPRRSAWDDAIAAVASPRVSSADIERAEHELFRICDPLPLATSVSGSRTARELAVFERSDPPEAETPSRPPLWESLVRHVDGDLADLVSRTTTAIWRRSRAPGKSRRTPWLVGGATAIAVLAVGLMWPAGGAGVATADGAASTAPSSDSTPSAIPSPPAPAPTAEQAETADVPPGSDLAAITADLLDRRRACGEEPPCVAGLLIDPATALTAGVIDLPAEARAVSLLDDFGGVAVLRVDAVDGAAASQLVIIARSDDAWLLRDVHDVGQQP